MHWSRLTKDLRQVYTAPTEAAAEQHFAEFEAAWGQQYPAIIRLWRDAWPTFVPFLAFPVEIRTVITSPPSRLLSRCSIWSSAARSKGRTNVTGQTRGWKAALNALALHYGDRVTLD